MYEYIFVGIIDMKWIIGLLASIPLLLIGCGGGGGGSGGGSDTVQKVAVAGTVMDGYLKNARVFLDLNDNGVYDSGIPPNL